MKTFIASLVVILAFGCKTKQESMNGNTSSIISEITAEINDTDENSASFSIEKLKVEGNRLIVTLNYSGGCKEHTFKMVGKSVISKSLPPIRSIRLIHNNNDDSCKALITKTLSIDISALAYKQESGSVIYLTLEGWKERIEFTYN